MSKGPAGAEGPVLGVESSPSSVEDEVAESVDTPAQSGDETPDEKEPDGDVVSSEQQQVPEADDTQKEASVPQAPVKAPVKINAPVKKKKRRDRADEDWLAAQKDAARSQHAERMRALYEQKQLMRQLTDMDESHSRRRHERFLAMVTRAEDAANTAQQLQRMLHDRVSAWETLDRTCSDPQRMSVGTNERGTLRRAAIALDAATQQATEALKETKRRAFDDTLKQSDSFAAELKEHVKQLKEEGTVLHTKLRNARNESASAWREYETAMRAALEKRSKGAVDGQVESSMSPQEDPFLISRRYRLKSQRFRQVQKEVGQRMSSLFADVKLRDGRRIERSKSLLLDYLLAEQEMLQLRLHAVQHAIRAVKQIDREADVALFVRHGQFMMPADHAHADKSIFDLMPSAARQHKVFALLKKEVTHCAPLARQGRFFASHWKMARGVVTRSGFFHLFDLSTEQKAPPKDRDDVFDVPTMLEPAVSVSLCEPGVSIQPRPAHGAGVFEVLVPNTSFFSLTGAPTRHLFRAEDSDRMIEFIQAMREHTRRASAVA